MNKDDNNALKFIPRGDRRRGPLPAKNVAIIEKTVQKVSSDMAKILKDEGRKKSK